MVRTIYSAAVVVSAAFAAALPAVTEDPSRTVLQRAAAPDVLTDNIVAAAAYGHGEKHGWGGGANNEGTCDLSRATLPTVSGAATPLPSPSGTLAYVVVGRGTQNYTCDPSSPSSTPTAIGAVASLYDASCLAGKFDFLLSLMPSIALQFPKPDSPSDDLVSMKLLGHHYFTDSKSPTFNLDTANGNAGYVNVQADKKCPAPSNAPKGQNGQGDGAVPWLALPQKNGPQGSSGQQTFQWVYRVNTAGGQPPDTCHGQPKAFEVQYAAEYWFYK